MVVTIKALNSKTINVLVRLGCKAKHKADDEQKQPIGFFLLACHLAIKYDVFLLLSFFLNTWDFTIYLRVLFQFL